MAPPVVKSGFAGSCPIRLVLPSSPGDFWVKAGHGVDLAPSKTSTDFLQPHVLEHLVVVSLYGFHGFSCSVSCCVLLPQVNNVQPGDSGNIRKCPWKVTPVLGHFFLAQSHGFPSCALCPTAAGLSSTQYEPTNSTEPRLLGAHARRSYTTTPTSTDDEGQVPTQPTQAAKEHRGRLCSAYLCLGARNFWTSGSRSSRAPPDPSLAIREARAPKPLPAQACHACQACAAEMCTGEGSGDSGIPDVSARAPRAKPGLGPHAALLPGAEQSSVRPRAAPRDLKTNVALVVRFPNAPIDKPAT